MEFKELKEAVERNIVELFRTFHEKPAIFLTEDDVKCYLYSLLINEPSLRDLSPTLRSFSCTIESSKTLLVHAEDPVIIEGAKKKVDISIYEPQDSVDLSDWKPSIGIEIKYDRQEPTRREKSNILEDVKKVAAYQTGYVLWLNWDREIHSDHLRKVEDLVKEHENVKFFYIDLFSEPPKTNLSEILSQALN